MLAAVQVCGTRQHKTNASGEVDHFVATPESSWLMHYTHYRTPLLDCLTA